MEIQITQAELREIVHLQRDIAPKVERLEQLKSNVKAMLDANLVYRYIRHPAWKQIVIRELGQPFADECYRNSPGNTLCDVKVEEHAVLPLWNNEDEDDDDEEKDE
jgi:hypothetical protein